MLIFFAPSCETSFLTNTNAVNGLVNFLFTSNETELTQSTQIWSVSSRPPHPPTWDAGNARAVIFAVISSPEMEDEDGSQDHEAHRSQSNLIELRRTRARQKKGKRLRNPYDSWGMVEVDRTQSNCDTEFCRTGWWQNGREDF